SHRRVDPHALHRREVDHEAIIADRRSRHVVAAAAHRHDEVPLAGEPNGGEDIRHPSTAGYQSGPLVDGAVPDLAGDVIAVIAWLQDFSAKELPQAARGARLCDSPWPAPAIVHRVLLTRFSCATFRAGAARPRGPRGRTAVVGAIAETPGPSPVCRPPRWCRPEAPRPAKFGPPRPGTYRPRARSR